MGPEDSDVAGSLNNLAELYRVQGRYADAEPLYRRALAIVEKVLGPEHPLVAIALDNLGSLYKGQGRLSDAEPLHRRSLEINEKALGPDHIDVAVTLDKLASVYMSRGGYAEAEPLYGRSLTIREKVLGPEHPGVARSLNNLAALYHAQSRYADAEALYLRSLAIVESVLGPEHPDVAVLLNNLALQLNAQGMYPAVESLYARALTINEMTFGPVHPNTALAYHNLALLYHAQGRIGEALPAIRRATAIYRDRTERAGTQRSGGGLSEQRSIRFIYLLHLLILSGVANSAVVSVTHATAESFTVAQLARANATSGAVARMGARFATGSNALANLVRKRQDAANLWAALDKSLVEAYSRPPAERDEEWESRLRAEQDAADIRLKESDEELAPEFPKYTDLASPRPVPLVDVQSLLRPGEALLAYAVGNKQTYFWAVRRERAQMYVIDDLGAETLSEAVAELRAGLDPTDVASLSDIPSFETTKAFELYRQLIQPAETILEGARHLFIVSDGALQSLPFGVLVTREDRGDVKDFAGYSSISWLAKKYAMTILPSVSSLRILRTFAKRAQASRPFLGIGDPQLKGATGSARGVKLISLFTQRGIADVNSVRNLASLPASAGELKSLARTLGADNDALILGTEATETRVKRVPLEDHRVIAFATHGLVAGDLTGLAEPALVLTPPEKGTEEDDGLLTASEVSQLNLDADWVILSACNTAAPDGTPSAEGLSGLAKAFFYAGSRALLVSHWPVESNAAVRITTRMLEEATNAGVGRAEAHRRAMLALMTDPERPYYAHPLFWAPFIVVGEGGALER